MRADRSEPRQPIASRVLWFVALWLLGVGAVAVVGLLIRSVLL